MHHNVSSLPLAIHFFDFQFGDTSPFNIISIHISWIIFPWYFLELLCFFYFYHCQIFHSSQLVNYSVSTKSEIPYYNSQDFSELQTPVHLNQWLVFMSFRKTSHSSVSFLLEVGPCLIDECETSSWAFAFHLLLRMWLCCSLWIEQFSLCSSISLSVYFNIVYLYESLGNCNSLLNIDLYPYYTTLDAPTRLPLESTNCLFLWNTCSPLNHFILIKFWLLAGNHIWNENYKRSNQIS